MTNVIYTSSDGNIYNLTTNMSMRLKTAKFHQFDWKAETRTLRFGEQVDRWSKAPVTYAAQILFKGSKNKRKSALNRFHASIERDLAYNTPGTLTWGGSYISCFIRSSGTYPADKLDTETYNDVEIYCPSPFWVTEQKMIIDPVRETTLRETDIQYDDSYGYPYSYQMAAESPKIFIDHYVPCNFRMVLYGPVNSVNVSIGSVSLEVAHAVKSGEYMVIDTRENLSADRHCYLVSGTRTINCFNDRDPESSLLQKLEPGFAKVRYSRTTRMELTVFKERSEPQWM